MTYFGNILWNKCHNTAFFQHVSYAKWSDMHGGVHPSVTLSVKFQHKYLELQRCVL